MALNKPYLFIGAENHKPPVFKEVKDGEIIRYGEDVVNLYPDYLIDLYYKSPKHNSIINAKVRFTSGGGWGVNVVGSDVAKSAMANNIINNANESESLNEVTEKVNKDFELFDGFAMEAIWNEDGSAVQELYHLDFGKVRVAKLKGEGDKVIYKYCYLPSWKGVTKYDKAKTLEGFKEWDLFGTNKRKSELVYYCSPRPAKNGELNIYPIPSYSGAIPYIEVDGEIANFHLNNIKNNFWGGTIVEMSNVFPSEEEKKNFEKEWDRRKTGTDNTGKTLLIFKQGTEQVVNINRIAPSDLDKQFDLLNKQVQQEIFISHNVTSPMLFGVRVEGQLGGRSEMQDAYEIFYSTYIKPRQSVLESYINYIYSFNGFDNSFNLKAVKPFSMELSDDKVWEVLTQDEKRQLVAEKTGIDLSKDVQEFSSQQKDFIADYFELVGEDVSDEDIVKTYPVTLVNGNPDKFDKDYKKNYFADVIGMEIGALEADILSAIKNNRRIGVEELAEAFDVKPETVQEVLDNLMAQKILKGELGNLKISRIGEEALLEQDVVLDIKVMYRYSGPQDSRNRSFCARMMALSKSGRVYSRDEIERLKNNQEYNTNVWDYRGGFYTRKGTDNTTPYCRHIWESVIVKTKRKR